MSHKRINESVMEKPTIDQNPMPHFNLLPPRIHPLEVVARHVGRIASYGLDFIINKHEIPNTGATVVLDEALGD